MVTGFELYQVMGDYVTADLIVWKRYRQFAPGIVEIMLDSNPQLAYAHRFGPFIPSGTYVRVPIDPDMVLGIPPPNPFAGLWTDVAGYRI